MCVACGAGGGEAAPVTAEGTLAALCLLTGQPHRLALFALTGGSVSHQVCVWSLCSQPIAVTGMVAIKEGLSVKRISSALPDASYRAALSWGCVPKVPAPPAGTPGHTALRTLLVVPL